MLVTPKASIFDGQELRHIEVRAESNYVENLKDLADFFKETFSGNLLDVEIYEQNANLGDTSNIGVYVLSYDVKDEVVNVCREIEDIKIISIVERID